MRTDRGKDIDHMVENADVSDEERHLRRVFGGMDSRLYRGQISLSEVK